VIATNLSAMPLMPKGAFGHIGLSHCNHLGCIELVDVVDWLVGEPLLGVQLSVRSHLLKQPVAVEFDIATALSSARCRPWPALIKDKPSARLPMSPAASLTIAV
jgi:hypothetical protein